MGFFNVGAGRGYLWHCLGEAISDFTKNALQQDLLSKKYDLMYNTQSGLIGKRLESNKELENLKFKHKLELQSLEDEAKNITNMNQVLDAKLKLLNLKIQYGKNTQIIPYTDDEKIDVENKFNNIDSIIQYQADRISQSQNQGQGNWNKVKQFTNSKINNQTDNSSSQTKNNSAITNKIPQSNPFSKGNGL